MKRIQELGSLFWAFAIIGATTFGGGYAMLPIIQREIVEKRHWATDQEVMDYYAVGQCTPGAIAVNTATINGTSRCGRQGGIAATLGVIAPAILIITLIAAVLSNFAELPAVRHAFNGIRACVVVLIFSSVIGLAKSSLKDRITWIIFLLVLGLSLFTELPTALLVILSGVAGYFVAPAPRQGEAAPEASHKSTQVAQANAATPHHDPKTPNDQEEHK